MDYKITMTRLTCKISAVRFQRPHGFTPLQYIMCSMRYMAVMLQLSNEIFDDGFTAAQREPVNLGEKAWQGLTKTDSLQALLQLTCSCNHGSAICSNQHKHTAHNYFYLSWVTLGY